MDAPAGKRMAPFLVEIVGRLRVCGELDLDDATAARMCSMSAATIDRRLGRERKRPELKGRSGTKPGSLLKSQISIRTWADWNENAPGFVEMDQVGHEGGDPRGEFAQSLTFTDVFTGWTETKALRNKAQKWVFAVVVDLRDAFPFPVLGIDSDNGSEFINDHRSDKTGKGNPYLKSVLGEAPASAGRTNTFPGARYRRLARRMGKLKASSPAPSSSSSGTDSPTPPPSTEILVPSSSTTGSDRTTHDEPHPPTRSTRLQRHAHPRRLITNTGVTSISDRATWLLASLTLGSHITQDRRERRRSPRPDITK